MKIAIISDLHDNLANLERFLDLFKQECLSLGDEQEGSRKVQTCSIICCGDVTTPETLELLAERLKDFASPELGGGGVIKLACGNIEIRREEFCRVAERHKSLEVFAEIGQWEIEGVKTAFVHRPNKTKELALSGLYNFVFYGHTHKPWIEELGGVIIANPGTLGGVFTSPTFAVLDTETGKLELRRLY